MRAGPTVEHNGGRTAPQAPLEQSDPAEVSRQGPRRVTRQLGSVRASDSNPGSQ